MTLPPNGPPRDDDASPPVPPVPPVAARGSGSHVAGADGAYVGAHRAAARGGAGGTGSGRGMGAGRGGNVVPGGARGAAGGAGGTGSGRGMGAGRGGNVVPGGARGAAGGAGGTGSGRGMGAGRGGNVAPGGARGAAGGGSGSGSGGGGGSEGGLRLGSRRNLWLLIGGAVIVLAVIVGLFFVGLRVSDGSDAADDRAGVPGAGAATTETGAGAATTETGAASDTPTPAETAGPSTGPSGSGADAAAPPGPLAPGVHDWNALHGGECLSGYTSPWELQFTVVDCAGDHTAQLVSKGAFAEDAAAPYPGDAELASRLNLLCTAPSVLDYAVAGAIPDIQWQGAYPANDAQWADGDRAYFCFFSRTSGEPLGASLTAAPVG